MRYLVSIWLLFTTLLSAQNAAFSQPAATDDGQTVYFLSPLILASAPAPAPSTGSTNSSVSNLYRLGLDGIQLLSASATTPRVSGDGRIVGYTDPNFCVTTGASTSCGQQGKLLGPPQVDLGAGTLYLSRNGRWAVVSPFSFLPSSAGATLIDNNTGARVLLPGTVPIGSVSAVASDGTVLLQQTGTNQVGLWRDGQFTTPPAGAPGVTIRAISDDSSTLIYLASDAPALTNFRLVARNIASGTEVAFPTGSSSPFLMGVSNDGRSILYRIVTNTGNGSGTAFLASTATGKADAIALPDGEAIFEGALNGSGNSIILTTTSARILRLAVAGGAVSPAQELVPATPYVNLQPAPAIGAYVPLQGSVSGTVENLSGKILLGGLPLAILAVKPGEVAAQVPWEVPVGQARFQLLVPSSSPFRQDQMIFSSTAGPRFFSLPAGQTSILGSFPLIRGDFSGFQTTQPQAGDIVTFYMAGLGTVQGRPVTGQPAPLTPLYPLQAPLTCRFTPQTASAKTLYAGLAPGMIGIHQVVFQMPSDPSTAPLTGFQCSSSGAGSFSLSSVLPVGN